jgi:hypothetical protein
MNRKSGLSLQKFNEFARSNPGSSRLKAVDLAAIAVQCGRHFLALSPTGIGHLRLAVIRGLT